MLKTMAVIALVAGIGFSACGTSSNNNGDGGNNGPTCGLAEFSVEGTAAGQAVSEKINVAGQALINIPGDTGCYVNVYFEGGGRLRLEWENTLADGQSSQASGSVNLEVHGGINYGNCSGAGFPSKITKIENGVEFVLEDLREAPYCSGASVTGKLEGCATFK